MVLVSSVSDPPTFPPPTLPPKLTPLFTISVRVTDDYAPIPLLDGGFKYLLPIVGGDIRGPALNGTITDGFASPQVTEEAVFSTFSIRYYGSTTDGEVFWIEQKGVGQSTREQSWLAITIGGDYQYLQHVFMLAQNDFNGPRKTNKVIVYGVNTQDQDLDF